jgi:O-antigen ligase
MAQSRSGIIVILVAGVVLLTAWPRDVQRRLLWWLPVYALAMRVVFPGLLGTIRNLFLNFGTDPSVTSRTDDYARIPQFIDQHPFFGRGFQTFLPKDFFFVDNQYIISVIETGFVGLAVTLMLFATAIGLAFQARRWALDDEERLLGQTMMASIAGAAFAFATFDFLSFELAAGVLFLLFGCAGALWRLLRSDARAAGQAQPAHPRRIETLY